jgi:hypothetical protein
MTEIAQQDLSEVESLLASRQRLSDWLDKLEAAGSKTPASVRERVRSDYQGRLAQVVEQLRGHSDVITNTLQGLRAHAGEYEELRTEEVETLAEAELRYGVGEYSDGEWQKVEGDCTGKIGGLDEELGRLAGEIDRLEEVLTQIAPPPAPAPAAAPMAAAPVPEPAPAPAAAPAPGQPLSLVRDEEQAHEEAAPAAAAPPADPPEAPRFVPRGGRSQRASGPARSIPFPAAREPMPPREPAQSSSVDELTFLRSMTLEPRNSGGTTAAPPPAAAEPRADRPSQTVPKTLKCGECGALNRPTEWYCERCGAELAAV